MMKKQKRTLALFYCQNTPGSSERERQALEEEYGKSLRLFPIPCSGRLEPLHLLRALEEFADAAYVIACPEGNCRYFEGNTRARKRTRLAARSISGIGLEGERVGMVTNSNEERKSLATLATEIMERISLLKPSPVLSHRNKRGKKGVPFQKTKMTQKEKHHDHR
jgi:F420-non-reducing hydrogenase iron-sulfur subunit